MNNGKRSFIITEIVLGILLIISLIYVVYNKSGPGQQKIAVIVPDVDESQWSAFKYGLKMAAQEYDVDIVIISKDNMETVNDEIDVINQEIKNGADAVVVKPVVDNTDQAKLDQIKKRVPVMIVGDTITDESENIFTTTEPDQYGMGAALANKLLENNNDSLEGKTIGIYSQYAYSKAKEQRRQGICDTLEGSGAQILWSVSKNSESDEIVNLQTQRKVDIIMALDNESVVEAGQAACDNELYGALIYGIGNSTEAIYYLDARWMECLIVPDEFEAGYKSVNTLVDALRKNWYVMKDQEISYTVLTRENLFSDENKNLLFAISQ